MKAMIQLRQRSTTELKNRLIQIGNDLMRARGSLHGNVKSPQTDNPMFIARLKRENAQIQTILHERATRNEKVKVVPAKET